MKAHFHFLLIMVMQVVGMVVTVSTQVCYGEKRVSAFFHFVETATDGPLVSNRISRGRDKVMHVNAGVSFHGIEF